MQDWIIEISSGISAGATIALALIALVQLRGLKIQIKQAAQQDRRRNTLEACQRFEKDPIREARKTLWGVTTNGTDYTGLQDQDKFAAFTLLVYFQGLAIGIEQDVYIEQMVKDFLQEHLEKEIKALIKEESSNAWKARKPSLFKEDDFGTLCKLYDKWFPKKSPEYRAE